MPPAPQRPARTLFLTFAISAAFVAAMLAITARWRLTSPERDLLLLLAGVPIIALALFAARKHKAFLVILFLLVPLGIYTARHLEAENRRLATASCANHSSFTGKSFTVEELPKILTNSVEFADYLEQLYAGETQRPNMYCPGAKWSKTKTGVAFVGAGLDIIATAPTQEVLIAFCHYDSHPLPFDHSHSLSLHTNRISLEGFHSMDRPIDRSCDRTRDMTNRLATALQQARDGIVPYTPPAIAILQSELDKRIQALAQHPFATEPLRSERSGSR